MKKKITLLLVVMLTEVSIPSFAQAPDWLWAKAMGGTSDDRGYSVAVDDSGNVYTTGLFTGTADFDPGAGVFNLTSVAIGDDIFISKLNGSGNFVWAKAIVGTTYAESYSITIDASGNVYTTGVFNATVDFDPGAGIFNLTAGATQSFFVSKLDSSGNFVWAKTAGGASESWGTSIALDASGNVYATGHFYGMVDFDPGTGIFNLYSFGHESVFVSKLDTSGNFVWAKAIGGGSSGLDRAWGQSITISTNAGGDIYTTGYFEGTADFDPDSSGSFNLTSVGFNDIFISKLDSAGNFVWAKTMGGTLSEFGYSVAIDPTGSGAVYTTGYFNSMADFDPGAGIFNLTSAGGSDIFISKLDSSGNFVWAKRIGGSNYDYGYSIAVDPAGSGDVYTTGVFMGPVDFNPGSGLFPLTSAGGEDIFILKLDGSGNFTWAKRAGGTGDDYGKSMTFDNSGYLHITGYFESPSIAFGSTTVINASTDTSDIFIAKLDTTIITGNEEIEKFGNGVLVFPNPAERELRIKNAEFRIESVEIYNVLGEKVFSQTTTSSKQTINVAKLSPGIYFVKVRSEKEERVVKFVKQ